MNVLALDLGGTRLKAAAVDGDAPFTVVTAPSSLDAVVEVGRRILGTEPCERVGLCVPGIVEHGVVTILPGKLDGLVGVDLRAFLGEAFGLPVGAVVNDAAAFGFAEASSRPGQRVLTVTVGTGVGSAMVVGNEVRGLLTGQPWDSTCNARALEEIGVGAFRERLAEALAAMCFAHEPDVVVLGGGPVQPGNDLVPGLEKLVNDRLAPWFSVSVQSASSGDAGGLVGVARLTEAMA